jgi:hypothetical protein
MAKEPERTSVKRAYLSIRLALESVVGVFLLFGCGYALMTAPRMNWTIGNFVGIIFGIGLPFDAFKVRRMLNQLDSANDPMPD